VFERQPSHQQQSTSPAQLVDHAMLILLDMKIVSPSVFKYAFSALVALFVFTGATNLWAHDGQWDSNHHFYHNDAGYWDSHDHYNKYSSHNHHRGYWDNRSTGRIFINID
jgi:hypothetical protein